MTQTVSNVLMGIFYLVPFVVFFLSQKMDREIKAIGLSIKVVDLLTPYLLFTVHIYSMLALNWSLFPYLILVASVIGIGLATFFAFKKRELYYKKFFRVWWRYVFLISFIIHSIVGAWTLYTHII